MSALEMVGLDPLPIASRASSRAASSSASRSPACSSRAQGDPARRAVRRPRPPAAAAHARRAAEPPARARDHVHPRDAQPGRIALDGGSDRRHERRADPADRRSAHDRARSPRTSSSPASWATTTSSRARSHEREGDRLVIDDGSVRASVRRRRTTTVAWATRSPSPSARRPSSLDSADGARLGAQLRRLRDRLRRVPRRSREAPPHGRRKSGCWRRCRASSTHPCAGARASRIRISWKEEDVQLLRP